MLSSEKIKQEALHLGFTVCGMSVASQANSETARHFKEWINAGCHAEMKYMENYEEVRLDPRQLVEGAQTIICVALNYYPNHFIPEEEYQIAWYAYGKDYHEVMKVKLNALLERITNEFEMGKKELDDTLLVGRTFCDTAPILEKYWAWQSGLGWIGKNTQLIIPQMGPCFFLGEIVINQKVDSYDVPGKNRCGKCTRCIDHCPTKAIEAPFRLNAARCLSYLTIEYRGEFNDQNKPKINHTIYGCNDCIKACPWNRFSKPTFVEDFEASPDLLMMKKEDWRNLSEEKYKSLFKGSAIKRAKYAGLIRNIKAIAENEETVK